jgi:hypothetical protein
MQETWLRPNRRVLLLAMIPLGILGLVGWLLNRADLAGFLRAGGLVLSLVSLVLIGLLIYHLRTPRIAYRSGEVLFYLRGVRPIQVPLALVEAFFLGTGPAHLPFSGDDGPETINLVARLSQRQHEWSNVTVTHALGCWRNGYVVIRGAWCEPLTGELVLQMNKRLSEVSRAARVGTST